MSLVLQVLGLGGAALDAIRFPGYSGAPAAPEMRLRGVLSGAIR